MKTRDVLEQLFGGAPMRSDPPLSPNPIQNLSRILGYSPLYIESITRKVGFIETLEAFCVHADHQEQCMNIGFTPLLLATTAKQLHLPTGYFQSLNILARSNYTVALNRRFYHELLNRETNHARLEAVREIFPSNRQGYINDTVIDNIISFAGDDAPTLLLFYESHIHSMDEARMTPLSFAYLVSQMKGPLELRMPWAPRITSYCSRNGVPLEEAIKRYNFTLEHCKKSPIGKGRKAKSSKKPRRTPPGNEEPVQLLKTVPFSRVPLEYPTRLEQDPQYVAIERVLPGDLFL